MEISPKEIIKIYENIFVHFYCLNYREKPYCSISVHINKYEVTEIYSLKKENASFNSRKKDNTDLYIK